MMRRMTSCSKSHRRFAYCLVLVAVLGAASVGVGLSRAWALPTQPTAADRQIALAVAMLMERWHVTGHALDDTMSERCLDAFLKDLDPLKLFFYQSDVDEFMASKDKLDDALRSGDTRFAYAVFNRFLTRVDERISAAQIELDKPHDFTIQEEMVTDRDQLHYPKTPEEAAERWRKRVKFDLLKEIADGMDDSQAVAKLHKRYDSIRRSWQQTSDDELLETYLTAMTSSFDPHSDYMSPSTLDNFNITMRLELEGIGASLRSEDGYTVVFKIVPGGAADKDGRLKPDDKIVGVGQGASGEIEDIVDMKLNDVVKKIRGKQGTVVRLEVIPAEGGERKVYAITRERIELKDSEARSEIIERGRKSGAVEHSQASGIIERGQKPDGSPYRIGVIQLPSFYLDMEGLRLGLPDYKSTTRDVHRLLDEFNQQKVDAVVVDLRWNGGGSLIEARDMTGLFIDRGPVVQVKDVEGRTQPYNDPEAGMVWSGPLVVLINKFSASASEIFAGAIQDYGRGIVIGDHATHGKGTVQQLYDLGDKLFRLGDPRNMGALKLTIQQFYLPGGDSTQNRGVVSDVELPSLTSHLEGISESDLDYALKFDRVDPLPHDNYHMVDASVVDALRRRSEARVDKSDYFARELRRIKRYEEQKDRKSVTLNKDAFLADREELNADKEEEKMFDNLADPDRPVFEMDGYGQEALDITVDYLDLLGANRIAVAPSAQPQVEYQP
jgi:carboxyl-terminal processing protease